MKKILMILIVIIIIAAGLFARCIYKNNLIVDYSGVDLIKDPLGILFLCHSRHPGRRIR